MNKFYFCDNNAPGTIYLGTQKQFDLLQSRHGGYPSRWTQPVEALVGQYQEVNVIDPNDGTSKVEMWDVQDASVFCR